MHCDSRMVIFCDDLYVCGLSSILVFSSRGELRREIDGPWRRPSVIRIFEGRLYLLEAKDFERDDDSAELRAAKEHTAKRIFILTADGEICQKFSLLDRCDSFRGWGDGPLYDMNIFGGHLVLSCYWSRSLISLRLA